MAVGRRAGVRVHASHLWGAPGGIQAAFRQADAAAVTVSYDMYPYRRSSTVLAVLLLPADLQGRGPQHTLSALTNPRQRSMLLAGEKFSDDYLQNLYLGCLPPKDARLAGLSIAQAAASSSQPPGEWALDLLVRTRLGVGAHLDRPELTEESLAWLAAGDRHSAGSDGIYQGQHPHPRGYAAFAALARHYLAGAADTGYQQLARHLSANAADVYGLRDRGRLAPGLAADICVIGPAGIIARASYGTPAALATGVDLVIVNGVITWRDGQVVTTRFPGQLVS